jgi:hypothetical protein
MPLGLRQLDGEGENVLLWVGGGHQGRNKWIQSANTVPSMNDSPCDLILDQKEEQMKFDKHTVIICEAVN